jgi:16S rRNA (cytosine967-C5)-methyltransferase
LAKSSSISPARRVAFEVLRRVEDGAFASVLLASKPNELNSPDRNLTHELVLGVLRRQIFLDKLIEHFSNRQAASLDVAVRIALRIGLYQLRFLSRVPASAAVNESVKLVRFGRVRSAEGFVNAILRRATREQDYDPTQEIDDPLERLAVETSHPTWLLKKWIKDFGADLTEQFAKANNENPETGFRVVGNRLDPDDVTRLQAQRDAVLVRSQIAKGGWRFQGKAAPLLKLVQKGLIYIQDEGSQLVGETAAQFAGERFLDLCAAPGSKTTLIASLAADQTRLVASDSSEPRLKSVVKTTQLHGLKNVQCVVLNGLEPIPFHENAFDTILVDAPCSGTGTLRRNPEIRWRITAGDIQDLSVRQSQLLANAATILKPAGTIVYSTCSIEPEENEAVVSSFLSKHPDFNQISLSDHGSLTSDRAIRTWPQRDGCDGFYLAVLRRKAVEY